MSKYYGRCLENILLNASMPENNCHYRYFTSQYPILSKLFGNIVIDWIFDLVNSLIYVFNAVTIVTSKLKRLARFMNGWFCSALLLVQVSIQPVFV